MRAALMMQQQVLLIAILLLAGATAKLHAHAPAMCQARYTPAVNLSAVFIAIGNGLEINFGISGSEKDAETCCSQCFSSSYGPPGDIVPCAAWMSSLGNPTGHGPTCTLMAKPLPAAALTVKADPKNKPHHEPVNPNAVAGDWIYGVIAKYKNDMPKPCNCPDVKKYIPAAKRSPPPHYRHSPPPKQKRSPSHPKGL